MSIRPASLARLARFSQSSRSISSTPHVLSAEPLQFTEPRPVSRGPLPKVRLDMLSNPNPEHSTPGSRKVVPLPENVLSEQHFNISEFTDSLVPEETTLAVVAARIGLKLPRAEAAAKLLQAITHQSFFDTPSLLPTARATIAADPSSTSTFVEASSPVLEQKCNTALAALGSTILNFTLSEYFSKKYPNMPTNALKLIVTALTNSGSMEDVAAEIGVGLRRVHGPHSLKNGGWSGSKGVGVRWKRVETPTKENPSYHLEAITSSVQAIVGLIYQEKGLPAAAAFINGHFVSRHVNIDSLLKFSRPKWLLETAVVKYGLEKPVARLLKESGRFTNTPYFVVGIFSGEIKLGEGWGTSLQMAEHRGATNALKALYMTSSPTPLLSIAAFPPHALTDKPLFSVERKYATIAPVIGESEVVDLSSGRAPKGWKAQVDPRMQHVVRPKGLEEDRLTSLRKLRSKLASKQNVE